MQAQFESTSGGDGKTVFVLTDNPSLYGDTLSRGGHDPAFVNDVGALVSQLAQERVAGMVLEIDKVMKGKRRERDRLFNLASRFPVLRTRANARNGHVTYLDPPAAFFCNLKASQGKWERSHERREVELACRLSREEDPSMAVPCQGTIFDISPGGCRVCTEKALEGEPFLHICLTGFGCQRPIYSSVRWTRPSEDETGRVCLGLLFIDLEERQMEALAGL
ncbi:PilZ domain-containing protein [Pseudodesulfovibrio cashew]|nr:PilZ domain-containing protein [Pseudodesulfovibrio cashew]